MGHSHHPHGHIRVPPRTRRLLLLALAPFVLATGIGLVLLWPGSGDVRLGTGGARPEQLKASVTEVTPRSCPDVPGQENFRCSTVTVELSEGPEAGEALPSTTAVPRGRAP